MKALIVEDYAPLRTAIVSALRAVGWSVDSSGDGAIGLSHARSTEYDAIVLDLMLPGRDGVDVLRLIRRAGNESPVLILTAKTEIESRVQVLDAGADDYLVKPFAMAELLARIRSLVRRTGPTRAPEIRIGDVVVDTSRRRVTSHGQVLDLSPREYALLEYLAHRRGQVVTRPDIWQHVYERHSECQSNVVDVYIGYLRRKLEADGEPRILHTRRGHGYVLEAEP